MHAESLNQRMAALLLETRDIHAGIQAGELEGLDERLRRRQAEFESFFGDLSPEVEREMLRAWIAEIQQLDAEARQLLLQHQAKVRMNLGRMHDSHAASGAYQTTHRMADDPE